MNLRGLLDWWLAQLAEWLPERLRSGSAAGRDGLLVDWDRQALRVSARSHGRRQDLGSLPVTEDDAASDALAQLVAGLPRRPQRIEVRIPPGQFLQREIELPLLAADNLEEAVGFQLDRIAPFRSEDAVYQCGVLARDPAAKRVQAWVRVAPRQTVLPVERLRGDLALRPLPGPRAVPGAEEPMVLAYAAGGSHALRGWLLPVLGLGLAGIALSLHLAHREQALALLEDATAQLRREAATAAQLAEEVERVREQAQALFARRTAQPLLVAVLDDLSSRLDDQTWLQRLEAREGELRIYGVSTAASPLIARLEASPLLGGVRFEAAVNRDVATGGDRFSIAANLVAAQVEGEAQ